jgi:hypothetical protein
MCLIRITSFLFIEDLCPADHLVPEVSAQVLPGAKVDLPAVEDLGQLPFHSGQPDESRNVAGLELNEDVEVALGREPGAENGPEEGKLADVVTLAESNQPLLGCFPAVTRIGTT